MKFGVCMNLADELEKGSLEEHLKQISAAGYDYVETSAAGLKPLTSLQLEEIKNALAGNGLYCPRANCFFPVDARLVGPDICPEMQLDYLEDILPKASELGIQVIVLGSGSARRAPEGLGHEQALQQFSRAARLFAQTASRWNIQIALEHLNPKETNLLTTLEETVRSMDLADHAACGFLFDFYHVDLSTEDIRWVSERKERLLHVHTALPGSRLYPFPEDSNIMESFFRTLKAARYNGTVSLEGSMRDDVSYEDNLKNSLELLRQGTSEK